MQTVQISLSSSPPSCESVAHCYEKKSSSTHFLQMFNWISHNEKCIANYFRLGFRLGFFFTGFFCSISPQASSVEQKQTLKQQLIRVLFGRTCCVDDHSTLRSRCFCCCFFCFLSSERLRLTKGETSSCMQWLIMSCPSLVFSFFECMFLRFLHLWFTKQAVGPVSFNTRHGPRAKYTPG